MRRGACWAFLILALPLSVAAQEPNAREQAAAYRRCLDLAVIEPSDAFEAALQWEGDGGGDPARHCAAVALLSLGQYGEAAARLDALAREMEGGSPERRAQALAQAAQAWLLADQTERAVATLDAALKLAPDDLEMLLDRSLALALGENYWEAVDDLNRVLELAPGRADALAMRASAYRILESLDLARDDAERAVALDPNLPEAFLERANIRRLLEDTDGARQDWLEVLRLDPDGPAADDARANLEKLDVKTE